MRYQRAPSKSSARAFSTPAVSAPAIGMAADEAPGVRMRGEALDQIPLGRADVGDDGVIAARLERLGDELGQAADRRRAEDDVGAADGLGDRVGAQRRARRARAPAQPHPATGRTRRPPRRGAAARRARSSRRSDRLRRRRPSWRMPPHCDSRRARTASASSSSAPDVRLPVHAGVGDRLPVGELARAEVLAARRR